MIGSVSAGLTTKTSGTLASAATAAVAMGLPADKIAHAIALSMDLACGTEQYVYDAGACDTKDLLAGYGARNGIYCAAMADFGFRGPPGALDGPYGYFHAFGPGYDNRFSTRSTIRHWHAPVSNRMPAAAMYIPASTLRKNC